MKIMIVIASMYPVENTQMIIFIVIKQCIYTENETHVEMRTHNVEKWRAMEKERKIINYISRGSGEEQLAAN